MFPSAVRPAVLDFSSLTISTLTTESSTPSFNNSCPAGDICQFNSFIHFLISNFSFLLFCPIFVLACFSFLLSSTSLLFLLLIMPHWSLCAQSAFHHISPTVLRHSLHRPINQAGHRVSAPCLVLDPLSLLFFFPLCSSAWHTNTRLRSCGRRHNARVTPSPCVLLSWREGSYVV